VFTERNERNQTSEQFVYVQKDDKFERRLVQVGISDIYFAEVLKGLAKGEIVSLVKPPESAILPFDTSSSLGPQAGESKAVAPDKQPAGKRPGAS
jgi:hypothetical protein